MRARDLVGQVPKVEMDLPVVDAARMLADQCLPGQCLPCQRLEPPVVSADATVVEIAALMVSTDCPLAAVVDQSVSLLGVVTLDSLLKRMFAT